MGTIGSAVVGYTRLSAYSCTGEHNHFPPDEHAHNPLESGDIDGLVG